MCSKAGYEIEKKFLIRRPEEAWLRGQPGVRVLRICQTYLLGQPGETARVRCTEENGLKRYTHTVKRELSPRKRLEQEEEIGAERYGELLKTADPAAHPVEKYRYAFPYQGHVMEIDCYPFWPDKAVLEVELGAEEEAYALPEDVELIADVTENKHYRNAALARDHSLSWRLSGMPDETLGSCRAFVQKLGSTAPAPGGGGAAAYAGALGAALAHMAGALTVGKPRYAAVEEELRAAMGRLEQLMTALQDQVARDAEGFLPLAEAYRIPKEEPGRNERLEQATLTALQAPLGILELCTEALELTALMAEKGSRLLLSDAGCAAALLEGALKAAALNVYINTKGLRDREQAEALNARVRQMEQAGSEKAEALLDRVRRELGGA